MYPATKTFWLEPLDSALVGCRRYHSSTDANATCPNPKNGGYHQALTDLGVAPIMRRVDDGRSWEKPIYDWPAHDDPRWPTHCICGYIFTDGDARQEWYEPQYRRTDTGELTTLRRAAPGAMWDAWWMPAWRDADGIALMVRLPNGDDWSVDSEASNCTRRGDRAHKCWIRHGDPRTEPVTVDKNGETCAAGAGSVQSRDYHGFLRAGELTAG